MAPVSLVTWRMITGKGRGVVARVACTAGTEVERSPVIIVPLADLPVREGELSVFDTYLLYWSDEPGAELAMGSGMLMIYNHSSEPNVEFRSGPDPLSMSVVAVRDIAEGEELLYDYGIDLWFREI